jgi:Xaa-Pro aminopeptidase
VYPHQAERLTAALESAGAEALVATSPANVAYVTGFSSLARTVYGTPALAVFARRGTALVVPAIDLPAVVADAVEAEHIIGFGRFAWSYAEPPDAAARRLRALDDARAASPVEALVRALDALGVRGLTALDESGLAPPLARALEAALSSHGTVPAAGRFAEARRAKGPWEIESLARALAIAEEAANETIQSLSRGATEREAAATYARAVLGRGGRAYGVVVAFGERAAIPAPRPSERALRAGDLVRLDLGCVARGYHAEVARTCVLGEPSREQADVHDAIQAGLEAALETIGPGRPARGALDAAMRAARAAGLHDYARVHVGYGIGLEPCETPELSAGTEATFERGEILRVETPYYRHGWGGLSLKDTVLIGTSGVQVLNRSRRGLVVLD